MPETPDQLPSLLPVPADWDAPAAAATSAAPAGKARRKIAFALGGLGGFNNYLGGVLAAALDGDLQPDLISCSSGAVAWTAEYLKVLHNQSLPKDQRLAALRAAARQAATRTNILPRDFRIANDSLIALFGLPGLCRPMWPHYFVNLFWPPSLKSLTQRPSEIAWATTMADRLLPAGWAEPMRTPEEISALAEALNQTSVDPRKRLAVVFNAYDPNRGEELLFVNQAAATRLEVARPRIGRDGTTPRVKFRALNDTAVRAALQLFAYGFDWKVRDEVDGVERVLVDGGYQRQVILSELHDADLIFAVRPINERYRQEVPSNSLGALNLQSEMSFQASYDSQKSALELVNRLLAGSSGTSLAINGRPAHPVTVETVEIATRYGFFDYFVETLETYETGSEQARRSFVRHGLYRTRTGASR